MARCQAFYKAVFGWEFKTPPGTPEGVYAMFSKPNTKLSGGFHLVKDENLIKPQVDEKGTGQATNRIVMRVEEVTAALKSIEAAGGNTIAQVPFV
jgi:predicted enzyme related to lactoylglutathione lyase